MARLGFALALGFGSLMLTFYFGKISVYRSNCSGYSDCIARHNL